MKPTLVVLAAGMGSRYGGLKQLDRIGPSGETILDYSVYDAILAGFGKVVFVIKKEIEKDFQEAILSKLSSRIPVEYVFQDINTVPGCVLHTADRKKPWGTAHALLMAANRIQEPFGVINADDFYGRNSYRAIADFYQDWKPGSDGNYCMIGFTIASTLSEHGTVSRGVCVADKGGFLQEITERTGVGRFPEGIGFKDENGQVITFPPDAMVSMNFWGFTPSVFQFIDTGFYNFYLENSKSTTAEYYIPTIVNDMVKTKSATVKILDSHEQWFGITYREDRAMVAEKMRRLVADGFYPEKLWQ